MCSEKLKAARELAAAHLKTGMEIQRELDEFVEKVRVMERDLTANAQDEITRHVMRSRVEVMSEYFRGEHVGWDLNETIRIYNEAYPKDAFPLYAPPVENAKTGSVVDEMDVVEDSEDKGVAVDAEVGDNNTRDPDDQDLQDGQGGQDAKDVANI